MTVQRVDLLLVARGLSTSRAKAQDLIRRGCVTVDGKVVSKPGLDVAEGADVAIVAPLRFVSRGGEKLDGALSAFNLDVTGSVAADVGASTGGFTDCLLKRGARKVYAIDVGRDQLEASLRGDPRVVVRDGTNGRDLSAEDFGEPLDLVVVDASFIGLEKLAPALARIVPSRRALVALIKPQFEVGRVVASRARGVIRDPRERERGIENARRAVREAGFVIVAECDSSLPGPRGNVERFLHAVRE